MSRKNGKHGPDSPIRRITRVDAYDAKKMEVRAPWGCLIVGLLFAIAICWVIFKLAFLSVY